MGHDFAKRLAVSCVLAAVCGVLPAVCFAEVPHLIRYQGTAVDSQNVPLEGPYTLTFRLYDAESVGTKVWEETQPDVPITQGHFSVLLGSVTPLTGVDWSQPCWLAVAVNGEELLPRQPITSVPLAIRAEAAEQLEGPLHVVGESVGIGTTSPSATLHIMGDLQVEGILQGGAVPWTRLTTFPAPCPAGQFIVAVGNTSTCASPSGTMSGAGSPSSIPKFTASTELANSVIVESGGKIGIGTANPGQQLSVAGLIESTSGGLKFPDGSVQTTAGLTSVNGQAGPSLTIQGGGSTSVSVSNNVMTVSTPTPPAPTLTCTTLAQDYSGTVEASCPSGYTAMSAICNNGLGSIIHGQSPPPPGGGNWNGWLIPNVTAATGVHCESGGTTQLHLRCCKLQ